MPLLLAEFRKCLTDDILGEVNEMILDAACVPQNISFQQDVNFLNEAREDLEGIVDDFCKRFDHSVPLIYRRNAGKDYLNLAKCKKRTGKKIRKAIRQQHQWNSESRWIWIGYAHSFFCLFYDIVISKYKQHGTMLIFMQNSQIKFSELISSY